MSTAEKIKISLECCLSGNCKDCPYRELYGIFLCKTERTKDTLAYIQQLEEENTKLHEANTELCRTAGRLERERDAAVQDIKQMVHDPYEPCFCDYCKLTEEECARSDCKGRSAFVWRGPMKEG